MKFLFSALLVVLLTACGFTPMYGSGAGHTGANVTQGLDRVEISIIPDQSGVYLRNALIDNFYQGGFPADATHFLQISKIQESISDLDVTINSEATRKQITITTAFVLVDKETGKSVMTRRLRALTSYNVLGSQFTTRVSENDAREAALNDIARQIENHVALYFKK